MVCEQKNGEFKQAKMTLTDIVDLSSDDELGEVDVKPVKLEPGLVARKLQQNENNKALLAKHQKSKTPYWW
ncbi:hypothetical protein GBA52_004071 [Prunus armeniaca]|nr:hypothetical protein GBA52_004071 [Prunus armeniaca]